MDVRPKVKFAIRVVEDESGAESLKAERRSKFSWKKFASTGK
jgi:hypothetical protein